MKKKNSVLRKVLAVSFAVAMLAGIGFTSVGSYVGTSGISVSAAEVYGDFEYIVNNNNTVTITKYTGNGGDIAIPSTIDKKIVISIGNRAFGKCSNLTSITIPDSVTSIGTETFSFCTGLKNITIGNGVTSIGWLTFYNCTSLTGITIPDSVISIGNSAFSGCTGLTKITIPDSVTSIGSSAFSGCTGLTKITIPNSVTSIGNEAFRGCKGLTSITIPDSVISIGGSAFSNCTGLKNITIGNGVTSIGYSEFSGCTGLTSITIPDSVTSIGQCTFEGCTGLTSITIPNSVTSIDQCAFEGCTSLTSITIPDSVTLMSSYAFEGCTGLTSINVSKGNTAYSSDNGVLFNKNKTKLLCCPNGKTDKYVIPDSVTEIGDYAFRGCTSLTIYGAKGSYVETYAKENNITFVELKELTNNSTLSAETIKLGETIKATAKATGGTGEYLYQVVYKQTTQSKWTTAQSYKANATVTFKPASAATYDVCVKVKDSNNTEVKKFFTVTVTSDALKNISTISAETINLGSTVTVNAKATGSTGFYTYAVYYKQKAQTKWTTKQDFKANNTVAVKPAKATTYDICVKVKDDKGTIVKKYFKVNVTDFVNTSTLSATEIKLGNTVKVSCSATGSTGFYQYAVYYKKTSDTKWTTKQTFSSNNTVTIKPAKATTYDVCVKVKDNQDNVIKKYFSVTVK